MLFYLLSLFCSQNELLINKGIQHRNEALKKEDLFMAEHLISEGYKVVPPE